jgi:hypothetical protein
VLHAILSAGDRDFPFADAAAKTQEPAMEGLTRLVSESLARHGFDRPLDYRRLHWSRWFRCESHHSLLFVPSKPGVFALAEEIMNLEPGHVGTAAPGCPAEQSSARSVWDGSVWDRGSDPVRPSEARLVLSSSREGHDFSRAVSTTHSVAASAAEGTAEGSNRIDSIRRMLAVTQFFEDDDMAFVLDRMLSRQNPMRARLGSGRYFVRFVVIDDQTQRRTICNALNQWMVSAAEKATGIGSDFATSLELTPATEYVPPSNDVQPTLFNNESADVARAPTPASASAIAHAAAPQLDSGAATNIHCPPFPSGF